MNRDLRESFHRTYMTFFENAERTRRWNPFNDIDWDGLDTARSDAQLATNAETFCGVELFLPDYLNTHLELFGRNYAQAWFAANWGYEESKHALVLREYLHRSGQRTQEQLHDYADTVLAKRWERPYASPREMLIYGMIQELTTFVVYRSQRTLADETGHSVLADIYRIIGRDEMAHTKFYQHMVALLLDEDRTGTLVDLAHVLRTFRMPAEQLLPDPEARSVLMRSTGINAQVYLRDIVAPTLSALHLTRHDLPAPTRHRKER
ncbi:acyl-ACP desaturase [Nocardia brasiliensis]|uniref:acyl-ACP desaturase n=1 Tax=Nocardia brasiliensis TaxID=37326 RepID=UPI0018945EF0|nr:acyl-ACP desaturase [Nocardia brasiliensis]MBF6129578.1 acyl-ACP desaturase [Nocardia brasiliensis]MBF6541533.1 acyl-ACP desaturase [Nocardia brasiliensis]